MYSSETGHAVGIEALPNRDEHLVVCLSPRDQHSVECIIKGTGQRSCAHGVFNADRQLIKTLISDRPSEVPCDCHRSRKIAETNLGGDLPRLWDADQYLVSVARDRLLGSLRQTLATG